MTAQCELYKVMSSVKVLIVLSVVTNGNNNLMPTISPFGISDKTLIRQIVCTPKEFYVHIYMMNGVPLFTNVKIFSLLLDYQYLRISLFSLLSPYLFSIFSHFSPPFYHQCQRTIYIHTITIR